MDYLLSLCKVKNKSMWKECIKGYEISSSGEVRNAESGRVLKHGKNSRGFHRITIKNKHYAIHRLMAIAFLPNPKGLPNVIIKDLDKEHLTISNLEWSVEHKLYALQSIKDRRIGNCKLTAGMIKAIQFNRKMAAKDLANMYNVSVSTIYALRKGKNVKRFDK